MKHCDENGAYIRGECCCNCKNQIRLHKHPWNTLDIIKGKVSENLNLYVCIVEHVLEDNNRGQISDYEHGMCELHEPKFE